jgi:hypothetical protein
MRTRQEAGGAIVSPELVNHKDEPDHRPAGLVARKILVQFLCRRPGPKRSSVHRAQLERLHENAPTGLKQRRMNIDAIELGSAVDKVIYTGGGASMPRVAGAGFPYYLVVGLCQLLELRSGDRSRDNSKAFAAQGFQVFTGLRNDRTASGPVW